MPSLLLATVLLPALAAVGPDTTAAPRDGVPADSALAVSFGGFVDAYHAWDANRPRRLDRAYTTQAVRHAEFNVNLVHVEAALTGARVRGRLALQAGTSVQANYAVEPRVGAYSGPELGQHVQEAWAGYRVAAPLWIDAGVFFAATGGENWISRDNPTYTRSLIADNSPYYASGVRATWQASPAVVAQLQVLNGWQNISETNQDKAVVARVDWNVSPRLTLIWDAFAGNEQPDGERARLRQFHDVIVRYAPDARTSLSAALDYGRQPRALAGTGTASWRGFAVIARRVLTPTVAVAGRWEGYSDPEQVIVATGQPTGLRATGGSVNVDVTLHPKALWRTEARTLGARSALFPARDGALEKRDLVLVTSLALTF